MALAIWMIEIFKKMFELLDARERRHAVLLLVLMLVMGLLEAVGVASVMPFIAVVANPEVVQSNAHLARIYAALGFESTYSFLLFLGGVVFAFIVGGLAFKALTHWAIARYTHMRNYTLSSRLLRCYLSRPYSFFLNRHSADLGKAVLAEVTLLVNQVLLPLLQLVSNFIVALFLIALVVALEPKVALTSVVVLGGAYFLIYVALRKYLGRIGVDRARANRQRFQVAQESLGGIKDVKVFGREEECIRKFQRPAREYALRQAGSQIIGELPRFALEALAFGGIVAILLVLMATGTKELVAVFPLMAVFAFAGTRLLPALQQIYGALTKVRFGRPALDALHADLVVNEVPGSAHSATPSEAIRLKCALELQEVHYKYPEAQRPALRDLNLTIAANTTVGLVGSTGAGKTTVVDIILGLLEPQQGQLCVDGTPIAGAAVRAWQRSVGYVPQQIFLLDDTVAANIAFGISPRDVDMRAVERAARIAEIHNFVVGELPRGYESFVGERGVRLSGGQRQRIGIARALYHDPDVLILDEATSALDNLTEKAVMDAVRNLGHKKTIILIAHRLSTVRECDKIFLLEAGRVVAEGTYEELLRVSESFRKMAAQS